MCEFCTKHGDGKIWYKNSGNYAGDLLSDLRRRGYIENFLETTFRDGFMTLGRLESIFRKKGRLPRAVKSALINRAKEEHFGQVVPIEDIQELVLKAKTVVRMPCACRWNSNKKEIRCCYGISYGPEAWYEGIDMSYFGLMPDAGLESVGHDEAIRQMESMEDEGLIHTIWTMMTPFIGAVCNCSSHDCLAMKTISTIKVETLAPAEYVAVVNEKLCEGCGLCDTVCQFDAISADSRSGRAVVKIDGRKCFGCGLCRRACQATAISLVLRAR